MDINLFSPTLSNWPLRKHLASAPKHRLKDKVKDLLARGDVSGKQTLCTASELCSQILTCLPGYGNILFPQGCLAEAGARVGGRGARVLEPQGARSSYVHKAGTAALVALAMFFLCP